MKWKTAISKIEKMTEGKCYGRQSCHVGIWVETAHGIVPDRGFFSAVSNFRVLLAECQLVYRNIYLYLLRHS